MTRVIPASTLADKHHGRLVSLAGHSTPRRLAGSYPLAGQIILIWRGEYGEHMYRFDSAVTPDTEITIHDEP